MDEFCLACRDGYVERVRLLIDNGIDPSLPDTFGNYPICFASLYGNIEVVRLLLTDSRIDPTVQNYLAIRKAGCIIGNVRMPCRLGNNEIVRLLLSDPRVKPKEQDGIYIPLEDGKSMEIAIIDGVVCIAENGNVASIEDEGIREKFVQWQYRIGGQKWKEARNVLV